MSHLHTMLLAFSLTIVSLLSLPPAQACISCGFSGYHSFPNYMSMGYGVYAGGDYYRSQYTVLGYRGGGNRFSWMNRQGYGAQPGWQYSRITYGPQYYTSRYMPMGRYMRW